MTSRIYKISWPKDLGPLWLSKYNIISCLRSHHKIVENIEIKIEDITPYPIEWLLTDQKT